MDANDQLEAARNYLTRGWPGTHFPKLALRKVVKAGGVLAISKLTKGEIRRLDRLAKHYGIVRRFRSSSGFAFEVTALGWSAGAGGDELIEVEPGLFVDSRGGFVHGVL